MVDVVVTSDSLKVFTKGRCSLVNRLDSDGKPISILTVDMSVKEKKLIAAELLTSCESSGILDSEEQA